MSDAEPPVEATTCTSASVPSQQQLLQEITAAGQLSDAIHQLIKQQQEIAEILRQQLQQQEIAEILRQQHQQQESTAASRSRSDGLRGWLMFVVTITASIAYSAVLNPPGGFWQADDPAKGYTAGRPVFRDRFPIRYNVFFYCNLTSFVSSLCIIVLLSTPSFSIRIPSPFFHILVALDIFAWAEAFFVGSLVQASLGILIGLVLLFIVIIVFMIMWQ